MSYTITTSDGTVNITIPDGGFDNSTSLTLAGPNAIGYGLYLDQNLLYLLENFASNSAPSGASLQGQLYFNKNTQTLEVYTSQGYLPVSGVSLATSQPSISIAGNMWFNTLTNQLFFYDGTNWDLIGPSYTKAMGVSGAIPAVVNDAIFIGTTHNIVKLQFGGTVIAIFNSDAAFQPTPAISGFPTINQGITINSGFSNPVINTNVTGNLTGNVIGNLTGNTTGNVTGITAAIQTIYGNLIGAVTGNVTASVVTSNSFVGNLTSTGSSTANVLQTNYLTAGNVSITSGSLINLSNVSSTNGTIINFNSSNINATGGNLSGITGIVTSQLVSASATTTTLQANVTANIGTVTAINQQVTNSVIGTGVANNFSSGNAQISGGNIAVSNANVTNANVTGNITANNSVGSNLSFTNGYIQNSYANTLNSTNVYASTIGNVGTILVGNISTSNAVQSNITGVGTITRGTWQGGLVGSQYGGTGVNNGANTISATTSITLNQNVSSGSSPSFIGTNFTGNAQSLTSGISTAANTVTTGNFTMKQATINGNVKLVFYFSNTPIATMDSTGNFQTIGDVTAFQISGSL
jgi:hypothetical protein